uniref:Uncharacterized protein n=1 Tax=Glossina brevipalpis TaxID=37001 RepID=A0A1A9W431_9MUSC
MLKNIEPRLLIDLFHKYFPTNVENQQRYEVDENYKELARVSERVFGCLAFSAISFSVAPLFKFLIALCQYNGRIKFDYEPPFSVWYPYEVNNPQRLVDYVNQIFGISILFSFFAAVIKILKGAEVPCIAEFFHKANSAQDTNNVHDTESVNSSCIRDSTQYNILLPLCSY